MGSEGVRIMDVRRKDTVLQATVNTVFVKGIGKYQRASSRAAKWAGLYIKSSADFCVHNDLQKGQGKRETSSEPVETVQAKVGVHINKV